MLNTTPSALRFSRSFDWNSWSSPSTTTTPRPPWTLGRRIWGGAMRPPLTPLRFRFAGRLSAGGRAGPRRGRTSSVGGRARPLSQRPAADSSAGGAAARARAQAQARAASLRRRCRRRPRSYHSRRVHSSHRRRQCLAPTQVMLRPPCAAAYCSSLQAGVHKFLWCDATRPSTGLNVKCGTWRSNALLQQHAVRRLRDLRALYDGLACCKTLDGTEKATDHELPDTRFAARTACGGRGIAPTTLKNKARPAPAPIKLLGAARPRSCPWTEDEPIPAASRRIGAAIARTQP